MTYVGAVPTTGDFKKLDSITTSSSTTFNLRQNSVAVYPQSANHCIVSLNGVIQAPGDAFNIVNDTVVFSSSLASSDVINFFLVLGNVNDIGTVSDDTVSTAKLQANSVTAAKFNADVISGQTALGATPADTDELLVSDAGVIKRVDYSYLKGSNNTPCFGAKATSNQTGLSSGGWTKIQFDTAIFNVGSGYDTTNDKFVVPSGEGGKYFFTASAKINAASSYNLQGSGIRFTVGGSAAAGLEEIHFLHNGSDDTSYSEGKNCNGILDLSAAAEVEVYAYYQHTGGTAGTITGVTSEIDTFFFGFKIAE